MSFPSFPSSSTSPEPQRTILFFGATRGVGYHALRNIIAHQQPEQKQTLRCLVFTRDVDTFLRSEEGRSLHDADVEQRGALVEYVQGDVLDLKAVRDALIKAGTGFEAIVFSIGYTASSGFWNGVDRWMGRSKAASYITCTRGMVNLMQALSEMWDGYNAAPQLIVVSSLGVGNGGVDVVPCLLRPLYKHGLRPIIEDKCGMEFILSKMLRTPSASFPSTSYRPRTFPAASDVSPRLLLPQITPATIPKAFLMPADLCVIRPALLTAAKARGAYRVLRAGKASDDAERRGLYSVPWADVGELICAIVVGEPYDGTEWRGYQLLVST